MIQLQWVINGGRWEETATCTPPLLLPHWQNFTSIGYLLLCWQGWLSGLKGEGDTNQLPTIAIVASYDTFGASPVWSANYSSYVIFQGYDIQYFNFDLSLKALSVGSDSNGSGVVALLEIARLFSRLYSNPKTRGKYNLLFGLTSGGPYNYNGTLKVILTLSSNQNSKPSTILWFIFCY